MSGQQDDLTLLAYQQSQETAEESTRCLLAAFAYLGIPDSLIDLGCGDGHLVKLCTQLGRFGIGVDLHTDPQRERVASMARNGQIMCVNRPPYLYVADLSKPWKDPLGGTANMVLCWEVAEHLPPDAAPTLCDTATAVLAPGGTLLWSAATPGQGGAGHLNERPHAYWRHLLTERGLKYQAGMTDKLRRVFAEVAPRAWWYGANLQVFKEPGEDRQ